MKTRMARKLTAILIVLCMAAGLAACGGNATKAEGSPSDGEDTAAESFSCAGKYISVAGEMAGIVLSGDAVSGFSMDLKDGGKGSMEVDGSSTSLEWSEAEGAVIIEIEGETMNGTIGEDTIVFEDFMGMGLTLTMAKEGTEAASASYLSESDQAMVGTWQSNGVLDVLGDDASAEYDPNGLTMVFNDDHSVDITLNGKALPQQQWVNLESWGSLKDSDYSFTWELEDGVLSVDTLLGENAVTFQCSIVA